MAMLAMAFPIPAGKTEQWKKFVSSLTNFFHCSVLPTGIGNAVASVAITSSSFRAPISRLPSVVGKPSPQIIAPGGSAPQCATKTLGAMPHVGDEEIMGLAIVLAGGLQARQGDNRRRLAAACEERVGPP